LSPENQTFDDKRHNDLINVRETESGDKDKDKDEENNTII
jgi:hypothetical protein